MCACTSSRLRSELTNAKPCAFAVDPVALVAPSIRPSHETVACLHRVHVLPLIPSQSARSNRVSPIFSQERWDTCADIRQLCENVMVPCLMGLLPSTTRPCLHSTAVFLVFLVLTLVPCALGPDIDCAEDVVIAEACRSTNREHAVCAVHFGGAGQAGVEVM